MWHTSKLPHIAKDTITAMSRRDYLFIASQTYIRNNAPAGATCKDINASMSIKQICQLSKSWQILYCNLDLGICNLDLGIWRLEFTS